MNEVSRESAITLRRVSWENLDDVLTLAVRDDQQRFVATNAKSIAQAHFREEAWFRAIYAGETPVGFLMLYDESRRDPRPEKPMYFLWRLMIDARFQRRGIGRRALELLIEHVRARPEAHELLTSCQPGEGSPEGFYRRLGFEATGRQIEGETEMRLPLPVKDEWRTGADGRTEP